MKRRREASKKVFEAKAAARIAAEEARKAEAAVIRAAVEQRKAIAASAAQANAEQVGKRPANIFNALHSLFTAFNQLQAIRYFISI